MTDMDLDWTFAWLQAMDEQDGDLDKALKDLQSNKKKRKENDERSIIRKNERFTKSAL